MQFCRSLLSPPSLPTGLTHMSNEFQGYNEYHLDSTSSKPHNIILSWLLKTQARGLHLFFYRCIFNGFFYFVFVLIITSWFCSLNRDLRQWWTVCESSILSSGGKWNECVANIFTEISTMHWKTIKPLSRGSYLIRDVWYNTCSRFILLNIWDRRIHVVTEISKKFTEIYAKIWFSHQYWHNFLLSLWIRRKLANW